MPGKARQGKAAEMISENTSVRLGQGRQGNNNCPAVQQQLLVVELT